MEKNTMKIRDSFWRRTRNSISAVNPFSLKRRTFTNVDKPNAYGVSNSILKSLIEKRGIDATRALNSTFGSVHELVKRLESDEQYGLSSDPEVIQNQQEFFGKNYIPPIPPQSLLALCFEAIKDPLLLVLLGCAVLSIGLSFYHPQGVATTTESSLEWIEGVAILLAVLIVVVVTGVNDWQKDRQFRGLQDKIEGDKEVVVLRDSKLQRIPKIDLVVGDIYLFKYGDLLQADGFLVQGNDVRIDESSLTGESDLIKKNEENRTMLSGTNVMEGSGKMLVVAVGANSQIGVILKLLDENQDVDEAKSQAIDESDKSKKKISKNLSVLQIKLGKLAIVIAHAGLIAAALTFIFLILRFCITVYVINKHAWNSSHINYFVNSLVQAITVIVVAVPEGLPLAVTLALAFAVKRMLKDNNLVRHLNACETMGNATTICSDKTGTLTTNRMSVTQCYLAGNHYTDINNIDVINNTFADLICEAISVNTSYSSMLKPSTVPGENVGQLGNKTECGLLSFVNSLNRNYESYRKQYPESEFYKIFTFNSARKMMTTIIKKSTGFVVYTKGASEMVVKRCSTIMKSERKKEQLRGKTRLQVISAIDQMAQNSLRTIAVAYRLIPLDQGEEIDWEDEEAVIQDMTCLCIAGIQDPVRDEVPDAIRKCQRAGVVVRMVTGDNISTARSIALQCGIIRPDSKFLVLDSAEFNARIRNEDGKDYHLSKCNHASAFSSIIKNKSNL
ncbi:hypothetical protein GJ496_006785 [Pomphorhynchus laevis]|nr:hypothetical protein GJ496_006785 [Pomphorhynchus laevis]